VEAEGTATAEGEATWPSVAEDVRSTDTIGGSSVGEEPGAAGEPACSEASGVEGAGDVGLGPG
jgi:hypothetical protein